MNETNATMEYRVAFRSSTGSVRVIDAPAGPLTEVEEMVGRMYEIGLDCWVEQRPVTQWERLG